MLIDQIRLLHRYWFWRRSQCIFVHVPKAAGTSLNHALYGRTLGHYTIKEITERFPRLAQNVFKFALTRHPLDRLISAYNFAKVGRTADMGVSNPGQYAIPEFDSFERFVHEWLVAEDLLNRDYIFQPQNHFVTIEGQVAVDYVGKVEEMGFVREVIELRLGRTISIENKNVNRKRRIELSQATIDQVYETYRDDFECFGYHPEN